MHLDVYIVIAYFIVMLGCGVVGSRLAKNNTDFMVAGRHLRFWMYFPCLSTVIIGGGATFGAAKLSYEFGLSGAWLTIMFGLGIMTMGLLLSSKMSRLRVFSISEMLEKRYSAGARYISAVISAVYATMLSVVQVIAIGTVLNSFLGWDMQNAMLIGGCVALGYTLLGGMCSVMLTDVLQFVLMLVGVFFFLVPASVASVGGIQAMIDQLPASFFNPVGIGWDRILMFFLMMYLGIMIGQDIWQRIFTARDTATAKMGTMAAGFFSVLWGGAMAICGVAAYILFPQLEHSQMALSQVVVKVMPTGLLGIVVAALLSALLSSCSGQILASSTLIINDLLKPLCPSFRTMPELVLVRVITALVGLVVLGLAVGIGDVMNALDIAYALLSGCVFVPVVCGFFWARSTPKGALYSMGASLIVTTLCIGIFGAFSWITICMGLVASTVGMLYGSLIASSQADNPHLASWEQSLKSVDTEEQLT